MGHHSCWAPARGCYLSYHNFTTLNSKPFVQNRLAMVETSLSSNARYHALGYNFNFHVGVAHKIASPTTNYIATTIRSQVNNLTCSNPLAINNMMLRVLMLLLLENVPRHPPKSYPYSHNTSSSMTSMD